MYLPPLLGNTSLSLCHPLSRSPPRASIRCRCLAFRCAESASELEALPPTTITPPREPSPSPPSSPSPPPPPPPPRCRSRTPGRRKRTVVSVFLESLSVFLESLSVFLESLQSLVLSTVSPPTPPPPLLSLSLGLAEPGVRGVDEVDADLRQSQRID